MNCNNKVLISFTYIFIFLLCSLTLLVAAEEVTTSTTTTKNDNDEEYYNLEAMTNEELEEICTSRGFELVREIDDNTGEEIVYTHQDYIDAATECLQIEEDLEEILESNPEILETESDRVKMERDRLAAQLNEQQQQQSKEEEMPMEQVDNTTNTVPEETIDNDDIEKTNKSTMPNHEKALNDAIMSDKTTQTKSILNAYQNQNKQLTFDIKEITTEVIQQIKSDIKKVINFIAPEGSYTREVARQIQSDIIKIYKVMISKETRDKLIPYIDQTKLSIQQTVIPSLKSFSLVVKEWGITAFDMGCRYVKALMDTGDNRDENKATEDDDRVSNEEKATTMTAAAEA